MASSAVAVVTPLIKGRDTKPAEDLERNLTGAGKDFGDRNREASAISSEGTGFKDFIYFCTRRHVTSCM